MDSLADALAECLEAIREGQDLDEVLERYPAERAELVSLLEIAAKIVPPTSGDYPTEMQVKKLIERLLEEQHLAEDPAGSLT